MPLTISRRDFLMGVLATGTLSAAATYLAPGGHTPSSVTLRMATGVDQTGALALLIRMWNQANPRTTVVADVIPGSTNDQRVGMESRIADHSVDVLNLDVINIPYFRSTAAIVPVEIDNVAEFLPKMLVPSTLGVTPPANPPGGTAPKPTYWAAPFSADVGMLFVRSPANLADPEGQAGPNLTDVVDKLVPGGSRQFAAQLRPVSSSSNEAFAVNVLEHALSRNSTILSADKGIPTYELTAWQAALDPLRAAGAGGRILLCDTEETTRDEFSSRGRTLPYMRNWPVKYRELKQAGDPAMVASQAQILALPVGVLGGQSLALVKDSPNGTRAAQFISFMTSGPAQRVLAASGLPSTHNGVYVDPELNDVVVNLQGIKGAIEGSALRPVHPNYSGFSEVFVKHTKKFLQDGGTLPSQFIDEMRDALK